MDTLDGVLRARATTDATRVALDFEDQGFTFADVAARADDWSRALHDAGVGPGARVAVMSGNRPEFVFAVYGVLQLGAAVVMCSPAWKARELEHACALTEPGFVVTDDAGALAFNAVRPTITVVRIDEPVSSERAEPLTCADDVDADAVLVFSSGTTGFPKAVRHTHRTMGHGVAHWITALGLTADDRFQVATPPVHILGLLNIVTAVAAGARLRLHLRFDLDALLAAIGARPRHPGDGSRADRARDGQPPRARALRPVVAALRDVGRHPGDARGRGHGDPPLGRALAPLLRNE